MCEKSSLLFQDGALSSSEDRSTTAGCWDVMCVRRAYRRSTQNHQREVWLLVSIYVISFARLREEVFFEYLLCGLVCRKGSEGGKVRDWGFLITSKLWT